MLPMDTSKDLVALFRQQVQASPDAVAVEDGTTVWTYAELDRAAERLAARLRRSYGVGRDVLVGVLLGHSVSYVLACLAALRAGGAFLVLEVAYPPGLLAEVLADGRPAVVLTETAYADRIPATTPSILLDHVQTSASPIGDDDDDDNDNDDTTTSENSNSPPSPDDTDLDRLAFVSYSSGTTGRPKGIANPHSAPVRSYALRFRVSDLQPGDRVACNVFFVWEMLRPLLRGATVVAVPDDVSYDPVGLVAFLAQHRVTETLMTPTLLATVLACYPNGAHSPRTSLLPHLKTLWLNGEVVTVDLVRRAAAALPPAVRLLNCYSASETHEIACGDLRRWCGPTHGTNGTNGTTTDPSDTAVCTVGPPVDPAHTYVLDADGRPVAPGVRGELYVGGGLLARGYLNRPELTAEVFLPDVFAQKAATGETDTPSPSPSYSSSSSSPRMYRTGDQARLLPSGELEISGRVGGLIKIRGYTVHPAAVESAIVRHLAVRSCVVTADGDGLARQLVAYIVRDHDAGPGGVAVFAAATTTTTQKRPAPVIEPRTGHSPLARRLLADHLAHYMLPVLWVELDRLPTHSVSGKIDFAGLPPPRVPAAAPPPDGPVRPNNQHHHHHHHHPEHHSRYLDTVKLHWAACLGVDEASIAEPIAQYDFFDLGGHSLALADLASRLSSAYGVTVPLLALARTPTLDGHARAVAAAVSARHGDHVNGNSTTHPATGDDDDGGDDDDDDDRSLLRMLQADSVLPADIQPANTTTSRRISDADHIFLTGATGFLGAFLLSDLLAHTTATIACLVRCGDGADDNDNDDANEDDRVADGMVRLRTHLLALGLWQDTLVDRVVVVPGDLARPRLGLSAAAFDTLADRVQAIVHAGAHVNLLYPYAALRDANVRGTLEILRLATTHNKNATPVHYVSTNGVLPPSPTAWAEDAALATAEEALRALHDDGYGQTKPVVTALLVEALRTGCRPAVEGWRVEATPVDRASRTIVALADAADNTTTAVYHVGDPKGVPAVELFDRLAALGYATSPLPWDAWPSPADVLRAGLPPVTFLQQVTLLDDTRTQAVLADAGTDGDRYARRTLDLDLLATYTRHFYARGWLTKGPRMPSTAAAAAAACVMTDPWPAAWPSSRARPRASAPPWPRRWPAEETLGRGRDGRGGRGGVDILVVGAGVMYFTLMANVRLDEWTRTVDVNCKGLLHCLAAVVPKMLQNGGQQQQDRAKPTTVGHIVAISSDAGRRAFSGLGVYSGSKFFVEAVLQSLRHETVGTGLRVTSVQPGNVATELLGLSTDAAAVAAYGTPSGARVLDPEDVAAAVIYALRQPAHVAVNEVLIEPRDEPI
ncbi:hybrid NRPS/PKS enzyme [Niveomyces insectorum RCEF 264]|uniref:Hybrid NRPS/PKS enzyme n=1 Tax=Niveomyces insectorum RCEF 264 TaxID=1081102 RepID=A0A168AHP9_9HYPO|nr:hybrid NRPS/PKS enzyme [Niveomyces insectorum RCEF 264]